MATTVLLHAIVTWNPGSPALPGGPGSPCGPCKVNTENVKGQLSGSLVTGIYLHVSSLRFLFVCLFVCLYACLLVVVVVFGGSSIISVKDLIPLLPAGSWYNCWLQG